MEVIISDVSDTERVTRMAGNQTVNVWYHQDSERVTLEMGAMTISMDMTNFFGMHEMIRKATAKLVMQPTLNTK